MFFPRQNHHIREKLELEVIMKKKIDGLPLFIYKRFCNKIFQINMNGQFWIIRSVNEYTSATNWENGKYIVKYEQCRKERIRRGTDLIENLPKDLFLRNGRSCSRLNLSCMCLFHLRFLIYAAFSHELNNIDLYHTGRIIYAT
jgi:hypothetical protein